MPNAKAALLLLSYVAMTSYFTCPINALRSTSAYNVPHTATPCIVPWSRHISIVINSSLAVCVTGLYVYTILCIGELQGAYCCGLKLHMRHTVIYCSNRNWWLWLTQCLLWTCPTCMHACTSFPIRPDWYRKPHYNISVLLMS